MRQATICLLTKKKQILLGMKKRGFGAGLWNGCGGKVHEDEDETVEQCAIRETQEEFGVTMKSIKNVAKIAFYFPYKPEWDQLVFIYTCNKWEGDLTESEEMKPEWFDLDKIPYDKMWEDDSHWLPIVLAGKFVNAECTFGKDGKMTGFRLLE